MLTRSSQIAINLILCWCVSGEREPFVDAELPFSPGGSRSCALDSYLIPGTIRPHDSDGNSRRRRSGPGWDGRSARGTVWGRRWLSRNPPVGVLLWHGSANGAGHRPNNGGAQCSVGIYALSATLRRRSANGRYHRRVGFDCDLYDSAFGDR